MIVRLDIISILTSIIVYNPNSTLVQQVLITSPPAITAFSILRRRLRFHALLDFTLTISFRNAYRMNFHAAHSIIVGMISTIDAKDSQRLVELAFDMTTSPTAANTSGRQLAVSTLTTTVA